MNKSGYIAAIARGHNAGICLLKDGEIVFAIEEDPKTRKTVEMKISRNISEKDIKDVLSVDGDMLVHGADRLWA